MIPGLDIKHVVVKEGAAEQGFGRRILDRLPPGLAQRAEPGPGGSGGKHILYLLPHQGAFLKPCPGTREYICCGYQILHVGTDCPLGCSYCILQSYLSKPGLRVFSNLEEGVDRALRTVDSSPQRIFRVGTGEFTDSLALDPLTGWSGLLVPKFSVRKNAVLELKTKTDRIDDLLRLPFRDRIVVSWSLNSPHVAAREEHGAPSVRKRLEAASRCQREGFVVGFHFDPLICHPQWREGYQRTLELLDRYVKPHRVIWISLGSLRFMPELKVLIRKSHPGSRILGGEFVRGLDGKMRYFRPIRAGLYAFLAGNLRKWHANPGLYLCMESDEVWREGLGWSPRDSAGLSAYLDGRVREIFG